MSTIKPIANNPNFKGTKQVVILAKENKNNPYLFNNVKDFINEKGITTVFSMGKESKIVMNADTPKMLETIKAGLKKMGIVEAKEAPKATKSLNTIA